MTRPIHKWLAIALFGTTPLSILLGDYLNKNLPVDPAAHAALQQRLDRTLAHFELCEATYPVYEQAKAVCYIKAGKYLER